MFFKSHFISFNGAWINDHSPSIPFDGVLVPGLNVGLSVVSPGPVLVETVLLVDTPVDMFIISNTTQCWTRSSRKYLRTNCRLSNNTVIITHSKKEVIFFNLYVVPIMPLYLPFPFCCIPENVYIVYLLGSMLVQPLVVTLYPDPGAHNPTSHFPSKYSCLAIYNLLQCYNLVTESVVYSDCVHN